MLVRCDKNNNDINPEGDKYEINWTSAADSSSRSLVASFWNMSRNYFNTDNATNTTFQYWPNGHALDILIDAYIRTNDNFYRTYIDQWHDGVKAGNRNTFYNDYYDDMEWNALAMLRAYKATNDERYKEAALQVWEWIKEGWNTQAGGGIAWSVGTGFSKNACSNGPACILAARLYREFGDESNKEWATKIYNWEKSTLLNANTGAVYDNINAMTGEIQKDWIFTYNQGTFIGSAVELYKIFGERAYLNDAVLAANYTISTLVTNTILKSEGTGDGGLFKGIFIRYFTELIQQDRLEAADKKRYLQFMRYNAETLWTSGTVKPAVLFGPYWGTKPGNPVGLTEQMSGCMLIEAMALLQNNNILLAQVPLSKVYIYSLVEKKPEFPGGEQAYLEFIAKNLRYPIEELQRRIPGEVHCSFIIEIDGSVSNVQVIKSANRNMDREAIRILKTLPKFVPGEDDGQPVRVRYQTRIRFHHMGIIRTN